MSPLVTLVAADSTTVTVQPGEKWSTDVLAAEKGDRLDYFYNASGEVRFSIKLYQAGIEYSDTSDSLVGTFTAPRDGSYIIEFENDGVNPVSVTFTVGEFESGAGLGFIFIVGGAIAVIVVVLVVAIVLISRRSKLPKL